VGLADVCHHEVKRESDYEFSKKMKFSFVFLHVESHIEDNKKKQ